VIRGARADDGYRRGASPALRHRAHSHAESPHRIAAMVTVPGSFHVRSRTMNPVSMRAVSVLAMGRITAAPPIGP
jgi:hypothetical protein